MVGEGFQEYYYIISINTKTETKTKNLTNAYIKEASKHSESLVRVFSATRSLPTIEYRVIFPGGRDKISRTCVTASCSLLPPSPPATCCPPLAVHAGATAHAHAHRIASARVVTHRKPHGV